MSTAPYFPLYLKDWLMDTRGFTHEDKGVLVDLLVIAWERGGLPTNSESVRRLAQCSRPTWERVWPTVLSMWVERDGVLVQPKLELAREHVERRSATAKAKAQKRWIGDGPALLQHSPGNAEAECPGNAQQTTDNKQQTTNNEQRTTRSLAIARSGGERQTPDRFETFWAAYPRHEGRKDALRAFVKLDPDLAQLSVLLASVTQWKLSRQWRDGFAPHAATWLNGERWKDEVPPEPVLTGSMTKGERAEHITRQGLATFLENLRTAEANTDAIDVTGHNRAVGGGVGPVVRRNDAS